MFFSGVGYSLFHHSPLLAPPTAWNSSESKFTFLPHAISVFCSLLSSLLLCMYLKTIFKVDVFRASEISLPASSQHKWNCIVKKNRFFMGGCIRIGALHRIISIASNCISSSGFALRSVPAPQRALSCVLWAGLCWNVLGPCEADVAPRSERLSPVHWLLGGHCQDFTLSVKPALK